MIYVLEWVDPETDGLSSATAFQIWLRTQEKLGLTYVSHARGHRTYVDYTVVFRRHEAPPQATGEPNGP